MLELERRRRDDDDKKRRGHGAQGVEPHPHRLRLPRCPGQTLLLFIGQSLLKDQHVERLEPARLRQVGDQTHREGYDAGQDLLERAALVAGRPGVA
ncbi:MAG: hypothetical protein ACUVSP_09560, partial [Desulfotomaculales bacterium]